MGKDYWNRKSIYSIRKFTVGTCSVLIGTCSVLFGANLAGVNSVSADETPVAVATEKVEKETPKEEAVDSKASEQPVTTETFESTASSLGASFSTFSVAPAIGVSSAETGVALATLAPNKTEHVPISTEHVPTVNLRML